ncbi:MAG: hypothetical protein KDE27_18480, partial [Planctomycetes bacterium]|nr:hypothetical protein [Planctomycetota bacterium]
RRIEKLLRELDTLEAGFRSRLVRALRGCAAGRGTLLFLVSSLRPEAWPPSVRCDEADELFAMASEVTKRRADLGLDEACPAATYAEACRRHVDLDDHHRPGPRQQARAMLLQLGEPA